ncbi:conserved Plasmodium protein, unknown function [Plasmodium ovale]|uniref:Nucleoporin NUP138 n=2 Tax=Plasmodium ovale TaxID=36330 RepID=A0A1A8VYX1_PLAOA|nr:conserved Plasmodium protein, unknown function [Plasmodium ovale curtisi]SBS84571.1 conserved Plasmodium protein, unknown function [Plasmodium ovale curtisi]SCQ16023.1 conserved Plasmodium protein, unknown function [Plasmodium ovale]
MFFNNSNSSNNNNNNEEKNNIFSNSNAVNNNGTNANNSNMWNMPNNNLSNSNFFGNNLNNQNDINKNSNSLFSNNLNNQTDIMKNSNFFGTNMNNQNDINKSNSSLFGNNINTQNSINKNNSIFGNTSMDVNKNSNIFGNVSTNSVTNTSANSFNPNLFSAAKKDVYPGFTRTLLGNTTNNSSNMFRQSTLGSSIALGSQLNEDRNTESAGLFSKEQLEAAKQIFANSSSSNSFSGFNNNKTNNNSGNKLTFSGGFSSSSSAFAKNNINPFQSIALQATTQNDKSSISSTTASPLVKNIPPKSFFASANNNNDGKLNPFGIPSMSNLSSTNKLNTFEGFNQNIKPFNQSENSLFSSQNNMNNNAFGNNNSSKSLLTNFNTSFSSFAKTNTTDMFKPNNNTSMSPFLSPFNKSPSTTNNASTSFGENFKMANESKVSENPFIFTNSSCNRTGGDTLPGSFSLFPGNIQNKNSTTEGDDKKNLVSKPAEGKTAEAITSPCPSEEKKTEKENYPVENVPSKEIAQAENADSSKSGETEKYNNKVDIEGEGERIDEAKEKVTREEKEINQVEDKAGSANDKADNTEDKEDNAEDKANHENDKEDHAEDKANNVEDKVGGGSVEKIADKLADNRTSSENECVRVEKTKQTDSSHKEEIHDKEKDEDDNSTAINIGNSNADSSSGNNLFGNNTLFGSSLFKGSLFSKNEKESEETSNNSSKGAEHKEGNFNLVFKSEQNEQSEKTNVNTEQQEKSGLEKSDEYVKEKEDFSWGFKENANDKKVTSPFINFNVKLNENNKQMGDERKNEKEEKKEEKLLSEEQKWSERFTTQKTSLFNFDISSSFLNKESKELEDADRKKDEDDKKVDKKSAKEDSSPVLETHDKGIPSKVDDKKKFWMFSFSKKKEQKEQEESNEKVDFKEQCKTNEKKENQNEANQSFSNFSPFSANFSRGKNNFFDSINKENEKKNEEPKASKSVNFSNISPFNNTFQTDFSKNNLFHKREEKNNAFFSAGNTSSFFNTGGSDNKESQSKSQSGRNDIDSSCGNGEENENVNKISTMIKFISLEDRKKNVYINNMEEYDDKNEGKQHALVNANMNNNNESVDHSQQVLLNFQLKETKGTLRTNDYTKNMNFKDFQFISDQNKEVQIEQEKQLEKNRKVVEKSIKQNELYFKKNLDQEMIIDVINNLSSFVKNKINFMNYCSNEILDIYNKVAYYEKMYALISDDQIKIEKKQEALEKRLRLIQSEQSDMLTLLNELDNENSINFLKIINKKNITKDDTINNKNIYMDIDNFEKIANKMHNLEELMQSLNNFSNDDIVSDMVNKCHNNELNCENIEKQLSNASNELRNMK